MTQTSLSSAPSETVPSNEVEPSSFASMPGRPLVGSLFDAWRDPLELFARATAAHGDYVRFRFAWIDYFLINDALGAHRVLVENARAYHKSPNYRWLKIMLGDGLLTSEGELWRRQRKLAQPAFHHKALRSFADSMVACTASAIDRILASSAPVLDLHSEMMRLTFRIVGQTLLSTDLEADAREFGQALNVALDWANRYAEAAVRLPPWVPTPRNLAFQRARATIEGVVGRVVDERRKSAAPGTDLLGMLMSATDETTGERMSDRLLMDELLTLTLAGHETTANALSFTFYLLSLHPDVARRARAEVADVLAGRAPTLEDLPRMPYIKAVLEESLRLYPPAWIVERYALEDDDARGRRIPRGGYVGVSPYLLHRNPRYFKNPEGFDPTRFLSPDPSRPKLAYMPFGAGPRTCIGNAFAMMEMQLITPMMLQAMDLAVAPGFRLDLEPSITLRPRHGIPVHVTRAEH